MYCVAQKVFEVFRKKRRIMVRTHFSNLSYSSPPLTNSGPVRLHQCLQNKLLQVQKTEQARQQTFISTTSQLQMELFPICGLNRAVNSLFWYVQGWFFSVSLVDHINFQQNKIRVKENVPLTLGMMRFSCCEAVPCPTDAFCVCLHQLEESALFSFPSQGQGGKTTEASDDQGCSWI